MKSDSSFSPPSLTVVATAISGASTSASWAAAQSSIGATVTSLPLRASAQASIEVRRRGGSSNNNGDRDGGAKCSSGWVSEPKPTPGRDSS